MNLFKVLEVDEIEEEIFFCMFFDLFIDVMNYFIKFGLVDVIKEFKDIILRKKK